MTTVIWQEIYITMNLYDLTEKNIPMQAIIRVGEILIQFKLSIRQGHLIALA